MLFGRLAHPDAHVVLEREVPLIFILIPQVSVAPASPDEMRPGRRAGKPVGNFPGTDTNPIGKSPLEGLVPDVVPPEIHRPEIFYSQRLPGFDGHGRTGEGHVIPVAENLLLSLANPDPAAVLEDS